MRIKRILVPIDFSETSLDALRYAVELRRHFRARLHLLHVVEALSYAPILGPSADLRAVRERQEAIANDRLQGIAADLKKRRIPCRVELRLGAADRMIVDIARRESIDLIVMQTHGRHGLPRVLLGSVAERVLRTAPCPVLVLRPKPAKRRAPA